MTTTKTTTTCQICGRPIQANTGVIAHHGYQRPYRGSGWQTASCQGARYAPYEQSCDRIPVVIDMIRRFIATSQAALTGLVSAPPETLLGERYLGMGRIETFPVSKPDDFTPSSPKDYRKNSYVSLWHERKHDLERAIAEAQHDQAALEKRLADWVPPNPPEPGTAEYVQGNTGYVAHRAAVTVPGLMVVYDRKAGFDIDADERWIVMHEPSSIHVAVRTKSQALAAMNEAAWHPDEVFGQPMDEFLPTV